MQDKLKLPSEIKGGVSVLSLFDGMSCGMLAFLKLGIKPSNYYAYEIDKYAIKTTQHNFPDIKELGDVFKADFTIYEDIDFLIGGSPCTYWSIAQSPDKRETTASGLGWELFSQYVRALNEAKPRYFLYENNKSMSKAIYKSISDIFGFEPILINSALVSAQNRNRYYWCGKRNDDGTYSKVDIPQPEDKGILLKDVLDNAIRFSRKIGVCEPKDKSLVICASDWRGINRNQVQNAVAEPVGTTKDGKSYCLTSGYANGSGENIGNYVTHTLEKGCKSMVAESVEPKAFSMIGDLDNRKVGIKDKAYCLAANPSSDMSARVIEPINTTKDGKAQCLRATCYKDTVRNIVGNDVDRKTGVAESVRVGTLPRPNGELSTSQAMRVYSIDGKSVNLCAGSGGMGGKTGLYAVPVEFENNIPIKAKSCADEKTYVVYSVTNGQIEIKGKKYPIKLQDGYYIIRKLTVKECMRLQTVPEWYDFSTISQTQAYKCLGNGWTVDVIAHILKGLLNTD